MDTCCCFHPQMHVAKGVKPPLESGYVQTSRQPSMKYCAQTVYALDCEMVSVYFSVEYSEIIRWRNFMCLLCTIV